MVTPDTTAMHSAIDEGAYVEHVGGGDREGLAPDHALAVEAPGVDRRRAARRRSRSGPGGASPSSTAARRPARPGRDPHASTIRPRRMPTERQTEPRSSRRSSARSGEPHRGSGTCRASWTPDWTRSSSRGGSPSAQRGGPGAEHDGRRRRRPAARATATGQRSVCMVSASQVVGSDRDHRGQTPGEVQPDEGEDHDAADDADHDARRAGVRRTPSTAQPTACPSGGRGEHPGEHHELGAEQPVGRRDERGDGQQAPQLDEPGRG